MMLLEEIFKINKADNTEAFNLRIQRGLSWLKKANDLHNDLDLQYISLWVSLNAVYAQDAAPFEQGLQSFLQMLFQKDAEGKLERIVWEKFSQPVQALLNQNHLHQDFWDFQNKKMTLARCQAGLAQEKRDCREAMTRRDTGALLTLLFGRLKALHHQLVQGGVSYGSAMNRKYLQDSCNVLGALMPVIILLLLENAQAMDLGNPFYPSVQVC